MNKKDLRQMIKLERQIDKSKKNTEKMQDKLKKYQMQADNDKFAPTLLNKFFVHEDNEDPDSYEMWNTYYRPTGVISEDKISIECGYIKFVRHKRINRKEEPYDHILDIGVCEQYPSTLMSYKELTEEEFVAAMEMIGNSKPIKSLLPEISKEIEIDVTTKATLGILCREILDEKTLESAKNNVRHWIKANKLEAYIKHVKVTKQKKGTVYYGHFK